MHVANGIARVFSTLFNPLIVPTLGMFVLLQLNTYINFSLPAAARRFIILITFINTAIVPVLSVVIMKRTGYVSSYLLEKRNDRIFPLLVAAVMFFMTYYLLQQLAIPSLIYFFIIGATILILVALLVTLTWKISLHMVSLGGFTAFLIIASLILRADIAWILAVSFVVSGITAASRIQLGAHTPTQVYSGYVLGMTTMILLFFFVLG